jgi:hypothetical protein
MDEEGRHEIYEVMPVRSQRAGSPRGVLLLVNF